MVICVAAGMGLDGTINRVAKEIALGAPEISDEFNLLNLELRADKARQNALNNLALRINI